jgi:hypothetical protein
MILTIKLYCINTENYVFIMSLFENKNIIINIIDGLYNYSKINEKEKNKIIHIINVDNMNELLYNYKNMDEDDKILFLKYVVFAVFYNIGVCIEMKKYNFKNVFDKYGENYRYVGFTGTVNYIEKLEKYVNVIYVKDNVNKKHFYENKDNEHMKNYQNSKRSDKTFEKFREEFEKEFGKENKNIKLSDNYLKKEQIKDLCVQ